MGFYGSCFEKEGGHLLFPRSILFLSQELPFADLLRSYTTLLHPGKSFACFVPTASLIDA